VKFEARIDELKAYYDRHRTFRIARKTHKGLYFWVQTVLKAWAEGRLPAWKQRRLMETGLSARQYAANLFRLGPQVAEKVQRLAAFKQRHGHTAVSKKTDPALAEWLGSCYFCMEHKMLGQGVVMALEDLGVSIDSDVAPEWVENFQVVQAHYRRHGDLKLRTGKAVVDWLQQVAVDWENGRLTKGQAKRLEDAGLAAEFDKLLWEKGMAALRTFHKLEGHANPTAEYGKLQAWLEEQRDLLRLGDLCPDRMSQLLSLGVDLRSTRDARDLANRAVVIQIGRREVMASLSKYVHSDEILKGTAKVDLEEAGPADAICRALGEYIINPTSNVSAEELAWIIAEFQRTEFELDTWHRERQAVQDDVAIIVEAPVQVKQKFAKFVSLHALLQHVEDEGESG
jgi:hypothetical protein